MRPIIKKHWKTILILTAGVILLGLIAWAAYLRWGMGLDWLPWADKKTFGGKTWWDWLNLLVIPVVLALGAFLLERSERDSDRRIAKERNEQEQKLAEQRREDDKKISEDQRRENALQSYVDKMTELLLDKDSHLRKSKPEDENRVVARIRTLSTLRTLDPERIGILVRFLYEADLIGKENTIIDLSGADLIQAELFKVNLNGVKLSSVNLSGANLGGASLNGADLSGTFLAMANLSSVDLCGANLSGAFLSGANLFWSNIVGANLMGATLQEANLDRADLRGTNLSGTSLKMACLTNVDLTGAYLRNVNLFMADLTKALVNNKQLAMAKTLENAIMPDGHKFDPAIHTFWVGAPTDTIE